MHRFDHVSNKLGELLVEALHWFATSPEDRVWVDPDGQQRHVGCRLVGDRRTNHSSNLHVILLRAESANQLTPRLGLFERSLKPLHSEAE